ncbi:hypothetical protein F443_07700 [Phytophthora nicotianae P1569]|uniref:Uncharacterized protein n=1 Tax=Phytophthora nicotianae P1569 TaxID=1317065 RepID=V9FAV4_PHYNI|nr:hypothetical protein F443_07700 [Phytophthora nicotianae P1569]
MKQSRIRYSSVLNNTAYQNRRDNLKSDNNSSLEHSSSVSNSSTARAYSTTVSNSFYSNNIAAQTTTTAPPSTTAPQLNKYTAASSNCRIFSNYNPVTRIYSYSTDHNSTVSIYHLLALPPTRIATLQATTAPLFGDRPAFFSDSSAVTSYYTGYAYTLSRAPAIVSMYTLVNPSALMYHSSRRLNNI